MSKEEGVIDLLDIQPLAKRDAAGQRERAQLIRRLADAENASYVEIVEQALALLDKVKRGEKL